MKLRQVVFLALALSLYSQFRSDVRLVEVAASVYDRKGNPVDDLPKDKFRILEDGSPQTIVNFESDSEALSCALLIDTTGSMQDALGSVRNAVSNLLEQLRPQDAVAVYAFSTSVSTLQEFTTDKAAAKRAIMRTQAAGQTALFDAIAGVSREIASRPGKKVIVLFTDGADNASHVVPDAAIRRAFTNSIPIYAIAEGEATREAKLLQELQSLATQTGGLCLQARNGHDVVKVFDSIQRELKHMYLISYKPPPGDTPKWRTIQIAVNGAPEYKIRGKQGYFPE
jgi:Ca-activated chloride channel family protein